MAAVIETLGLTRRFGERLAVDGISMTVPERCIYGFLGRNGAGKTTTLKLLLALLRPDAGQIRIAGIDLATNRVAAMRKVGALLESEGFYSHLSGRENLALGCRLRGVPTTEIDRVLDIADMQQHGKRRIADYSLGMRQRLGLARAMLGAPAVLILDEPTNGLDPDGIAELRIFLRELPQRSGATVVLSSHLLSEVEQTATHVGLVSGGRLVKQGALAELKMGLASEVLIDTDKPERAMGVARERGFTISKQDGALVASFGPHEDLRGSTAALNRALCLAGIDVHALVPRQSTLETLFRNATQSGGRAAHE